MLASADVELLKDVPEVCFHRPLADEQALGNLAVRPPLGREACDAKLAGGQRLEAGEDRLARSPAGSEEFFAGTRRELGCARAMGELESLPEMFAGFNAVALAAKRRPEREQRPSQFDRSGGLAE